MTVHIWYSGATDITGRALQDALAINGGREKPINLKANDILIGWGTKTKQNINLPLGKILNHPNAIRKNRNKFSALEVMAANRDLAGNIAIFCKADQIKRKIQEGAMALPMVGRKNYHQGGAGWWTCICDSHVDLAIEEGVQYFQKFLDIKTEYRVHVFDGKIIYAVKKVENATEAGWVAQRKQKILDYAQKNNINVNQATMDYVLGKLYKEQQLPDRIVRSNHRGWKFSSVALNLLSAPLKNAAIKAVAALGLDFGAVDCCIDMKGHPWILEINSGPGLQGTTLVKYTAAFKAKIAELQKPVAKKAAAPKKPAARKQVAAVGAAPADAEAQPGAIGGAALRLMMNQVNTPEEAQKVLDIAMGRV